MDSPTTPDLRQRAAFDFFTRESLRIADLDQNRHVNNLALLALLENARNRFIEERTPLVRNEQRTYMLVHLESDFIGELNYPGTPDAGCRVVEVRRSAVVFGQGLFDGERPIVTARAVTVNVDRTLRKAAPFDDEERAKLLALMAQP